MEGNSTISNITATPIYNTALPNEEVQGSSSVRRNIEINIIPVSRHGSIVPAEEAVKHTSLWQRVVTVGGRVIGPTITLGSSLFLIAALSHVMIQQACVVDILKVLAANSDKVGSIGGGRLAEMLSKFVLKAMPVGFALTALSAVSDFIGECKFKLHNA